MGKVTAWLWRLLGRRLGLEGCVAVPEEYWDRILDTLELAELAKQIHPEAGGGAGAFVHMCSQLRSDIVAMHVGMRL